MRAACSAEAEHQCGRMFAIDQRQKQHPYLSSFSATGTMTVLSGLPGKLLWPLYGDGAAGFPSTVMQSLWFTGEFVICKVRPWYSGKSSGVAWASTRW